MATTMAGYQESKLTEEQKSNIDNFAELVNGMSEEMVKETLVAEFIRMIYLDKLYKEKLIKAWRINTEQV